jgi:hypothetical protein
MSNATFSQAQAFADMNNLVAPVVIAPLRPHITGGNAKLFRYSVASEKALIALGAYNPGSNTEYDYPNLPANSLVDTSYVDLWVDNALLTYYNKATGTGDTIAPVASYLNRIKAAVTVWKTGNGFSRAASLYDRDVQIGDTVYISDGTNSLTTLVAGLIPSIVASSLSSVTEDAGNASTQSATHSISQTAGTVNDVSAATNVAAYAGLIDGTINETYTITVIQAPTTPGVASSALLSVTSASGLDNQASLAPSAYGVPTNIGTRGATVTFSHTSNDFVLGQVWTLTIAQVFTAPTATASGTYTGTQNLTYVITVVRGGVDNPATNPIANPTTAATINVTGGGSSGGFLPAGAYYASYTFVTSEGETAVGTSESNSFSVSAGDIPQVTLPSLPVGAVAINLYVTNTGGGTGTEKLYARDITATTYNLAVATYNGSTFANSTSPPSVSTANVVVPQVTAVDTTGVDSSGPTTVSSSKVASIGSFGISVTFSAHLLRAGDKFYVTGTAASSGAIETILLSNNMPSAMLSDSDLTVKLSIAHNGLGINANKIESPPDLNWVATEDNFTANADITTFDPTWTNMGVQMALPLTSGNLFLEYRAWLSTYTNSVTLINDPTTLVSVLGTIDPDNPLSYAVSKALANANNQNVAFTAVADPTNEALWTDVLTILSGLPNVYGLVPLSHDPVVLAAWAAHVNTQSTSPNQNFRVFWWSLQPQTTIPIVTPATTTDGSVAMATLANNPSVSGTNYTLLTVTTNNANFVSNGVVPGDSVRYLFSVDGFGNAVYSTFTVASVVNQDQLILLIGNSGAVSVAQRVEIWRNQTPDSIASSLATQITGQASTRSIPVFPGQMLDGTLVVDGYFLCAALAGLAGAVPPHQSILNMQLSGFSGIPSGSNFNNGQLNTIEAAGCFTIQQEFDGTLYIRKARTSNQAGGVPTGDESAVRDLDAAQLFFQGTLQNLLGQTNIVATDLTVGATALVRNALSQAIQFAINNTNIIRLGSMILAGTTVNVVRPHAVFQNTLVVQMTIFRPYGLGAIQISVTAGN